MTTVSLTDEELELTHHALQAYLTAFGHDEADTVTRIKQVIERFRAEVPENRREPVTVTREDELEPADPTPGMFRKRAFALPTLWAGRVETAPGAVSGWHHHARNETTVYVLAGKLRMEFEGGEEPLDAGPGDFVRVPAYTVHRESNPTDEPSMAVIVRSGGGVPTVNVDAPDGRSDGASPVSSR